MQSDIQHELESSKVYVQTLTELENHKEQSPQLPTNVENVEVDSQHSLREEEETPIVIPSSHDTVDPFPVEVLPTPFRSFIEQSAAALPCPPDLLAVHLLTLAGAALGQSRAIEIKPGWREAPLLFSAVVAQPGTKKSPALKLIATPLKRRQTQLYAAYTQQREKYAQDVLRYEIELTEWKKSAGKHAEAPLPACPDEPQLAQLFTTDATVEAIALLLQSNPRGITYLSDELTAWVRSFNQYKNGKGADKQHWLSFWNGAQIVVNRKATKDPVMINNPFVAVTGCLPPDVLSELSDERGRDDGYIHRVLFSFPDPIPQRWTDHDIPDRATEDYTATFSRLFDLQPEPSPDGELRPHVVRFTTAAKELWKEWINTHNAELESEAPHLRGPWAKLEGYCARLTLILHYLRFVAAETSTEAIDERDVACAWLLVDYFKSHARRVYAQLRSDPSDRRAEATAAWIRAHGNQATVRDLVSYRVSNIKRASEAKTLLKDLVDFGYGILKPVGKREIFTLHPSLHSAM